MKTMVVIDEVASGLTKKQWRFLNKSVKRNDNTPKRAIISRLYEGAHPWNTQQIRGVPRQMIVLDEWFPPKADPVKSMQDSADTNPEAALRAILAKAQRHL